eukprot:1157163-Pelagomonas_calceolata.AAC.1
MQIGLKESHLFMTSQYHAQMGMGCTGDVEAQLQLQQINPKFQKRKKYVGTERESLYYYPNFKDCGNASRLVTQ